MKLFFTIVYKRIITLTMIIQDHPLVEYPLQKTVLLHLTVMEFYKTKIAFLAIISNWLYLLDMDE
jgi:hypothetical protein